MNRTGQGFKKGEERWEGTSGKNHLIFHEAGKQGVKFLWDIWETIPTFLTAKGGHASGEKRGRKKVFHPMHWIEL